MTTDRLVKVTLTAETTAYKAKMAEASRATSTFGSDGKRQIAGVAGETSRLGSAAGAMGAAWKVAAGTLGTVAATRVVQFLGDSVKAASDLEQTLMKSRTIFGSYAGDMESWAGTASDSVLLSKEAALSAAAGFGDMFKQLGFAGNAAAQMSRDVVQMSADLGSFNNLPTADVLARISAAFRGEYDALQKVIPNINAARVEQEALAATGKTATASLTAQEKAAAVLAIVHKDGAKAMGDVARSAGTLAIEQQRANAEWQNAKAAIGDALLPLMTDLAQLAISGARGLTDLVGALQAVPAPVWAMVAAITAAHLLNKPLTSMTSASVSGLRSMTEALNYARMAAERAGGGFKGAAVGLQTFTRGMGPAGGATGMLKSAAGGLMGVLGGPWGIALSGATLAVTAYMQAQENARQAADAFRKTLDEQTGAFTESSRELAKTNFFKDFSEADYARVQDSLNGARVGIDDLIVAIEQGGPAVDEFNARFDEWRATQDRNATGLSQWGETLGNSFAAVRRDTDAASEAFRVHEKVSQGIEEAGRGVADGQRDVAGATRGVADASADAKRKLDEYLTSMIAAGQAVLSSREAQRRLTESTWEADEALKENGKTLSSKTKAGVANQKALDGMARAMLDAAEAAYKETGSEEVMRGSLSKSRESLIATGIRFGMTRAQAQTYADSILKIPPKASTVASFDAVSASRAVERWRVTLNGLDGRVVTTYVNVVKREAGTAGASTSGGLLKASGGFIAGPGTATSDSIPAWLSNGEFVVRASAVQRYGRSFFEGLNAMRFASGGLVASTRAASPATTTQDARDYSRTYQITAAAVTASDLVREIRASERMDAALNPVFE